MKMNEIGRKALRHHEGVRNKPYRDSVGLWTIGVGHLIATPEQMKMTIAERKLSRCPAEWNRTLTNAEVDQVLQDDLQRFERGVLRYCPTGLTQGRFNALVSFAFNAGLGGLQKSSIRSKHNRGDYDSAADAFLLYRMASGVIQKGLVNRRNDERVMYLS